MVERNLWNFGIGIYLAVKVRVLYVLERVFVLMLLEKVGVLIFSYHFRPPFYIVFLYTICDVDNYITYSAVVSIGYEKSDYPSRHKDALIL